MSLPAADIALLQWELALRAIDLLHADPHGLGGMVVRGRHGPVRDRFLAALDEHFNIKRVPINVSEDSLFGGLDVSATLATGRTVMQPGLLEEPGSLLLFCGAERLPPRIAGLLASALDKGFTGANSMGANPIPPMILIDESLDDEPGLAGSAIAERLALQFEIPQLSYRDVGPALEREAATSNVDASPKDDASSAIGTIDASAQLAELTRLAERLGIDSIRAVLLALRTARVSAHVADEAVVTTRAAALAVQLVLAPRSQQLPDRSEEDVPEDGSEDTSEDVLEDESDAANDDQHPEADDPAEPSPAQPPDLPPDLPPTNDLDEEQAPPTDNPNEVEPLPESLVDAASAVMPSHLLASLAQGQKIRSGMAGREGDNQVMASSGRPVGVMRPRGRRPERRMNLLETLKAAAPKQRLRGRLAGDGKPPAIRSDDFRLTRYKQPSRTTTVFVVDASGSAAQSRLAEAKGAVELLLAECYVRRDRVALVTFRGTGAMLDLSPTRSLTRAKRCLAGLPGGGGTPLAAGFNVAADLLEQLHKAGESTVAVFMTDGKANIANSGEASRPQAMEDAEQAARRLRALPTRLLMIDTAPRPRAATAALANLMQARYLPLPMANATGLPALVAGTAG